MEPNADCKVNAAAAVNECHESASLINPDFSGLWSVSWIGGRLNPKHVPSRLDPILSLVAHSTVTTSWIYGCICPIFFVPLLYFRCYTTIAVLLSIIVYPYIFAIKPWPAVSRFYVQHGANYFEGGASMCYEVPPNPINTDLKDRVPSMVAYHPHGIFCLGMFYNSGVRLQGVEDQSTAKRDYFCGNVYSEDKLAAKCSLRESKIPYIGLADGKLTKAPLFNHFGVKWTGVIQSSSGSNVRRLMESKQSFGLIPGGFYEISFFEYGKEFTFLQKKKGFIKYALRYGYQVIPCYTFGEARSFSNLFSVLSARYPTVQKITKWMATQNIPAGFFYGGYPWFNILLPYSKGVGIHSVHGPAIKIPKIENPTQDDIDKYHEEYCQALRALFDRNKKRFGMDDVQLIMM